MAANPQYAGLEAYRTIIDNTIADMEQRRVMARIWSKDHTVWKPTPTEIVNRLGWLHSPKDMTGKRADIDAFVNEVRAEGYTHALLLGMGGSSLAPEVFRKTFGVKEGYLDLAVLDSTDPAAVRACAEWADTRKTLFIISTKSGGTVETFSFMKYFYHLASGTLGSEQAGRHFIAITDPGSGLAALAERFHFRKTFLNDPDIGGRYSALSYFGLIPAALIGVDLDVFLERAVSAMHGESSPHEAGKITTNGAFLGAVLGALAKSGRDKVTFVFSPIIAGFGNWLEQLIAESTGKEGKGIMPVVGEPLGDVSAYGPDRVFVYLHMGSYETEDNNLSTLEKAGHPVLRMQLHDAYDLGGQCFLWEMVTAVAGACMGINPFDQPDVEAAKALARETLASYRQRGKLPDELPSVVGTNVAVYGDIQAKTPSEAFDAFIGQAKPGAYVALQAYVQPTAEMDAALLALRIQIRDRFHLATSVGYGPRYLHSTGQLHKGDGGKGLFIQLTTDNSMDMPIPDEMDSPASSITFGTLKSAQAAGDWQALKNAGRSIIRFHQTGNPSRFGSWLD